VSRVAAHRGAARSVAWSGDALWTSGVDGALRQWSLDGDTLRLRSEVSAATSVRLARVFPGGWAAGVDDGVLLISRPGAPAPLRFELDRPIYAIDVSPDLRRLAASILGEIVIVDLRDDQLATVGIDSITSGPATFVDASSLAVATASGLKVVHVDRLNYVRF
jgi:hypothetical protein